MKHFWINNKGSHEEVTAFFLGWGADEHCLSQIKGTPENTVVFYDYTDLNTTVDLSIYSKINIIAWSMGVFNAQCYILDNDIHPVSQIAIAGTGAPIHQTMGLIPSVCQATYDNWSEKTRIKFSSRMCGSFSALAQMQSMMSARTVDDQKTELGAIMKRVSMYADRLSHSLIIWDKAYISTEDLIFLPDNQRKYWSMHADKIIEIKMPHFPFSYFKWLVNI